MGYTIAAGDLVRINETGANVYNDPLTKEKVASLCEGEVGLVLKTVDIQPAGYYVLVCSTKSVGWTHMVWFDKILRRE